MVVNAIGISFGPHEVDPYSIEPYVKVLEITGHDQVGSNSNSIVDCTGNSIRQIR